MLLNHNRVSVRPELSHVQIFAKEPSSPFQTYPRLSKQLHLTKLQGWEQVLCLLFYIEPASFSLQLNQKARNKFLCRKVNDKHTFQPDAVPSF